MKMLKIAAIVALMASTTFGAVTVTVDPMNATYGADKVVALKISYSAQADNLCGMSLFLQPAADNELEIVGFVPGLTSTTAGGLSQFSPTGTTANKNKIWTDPQMDWVGTLPMDDPDAGVAVPLTRVAGSLGMDIGATPHAPNSFLPLNNIDQEYATIYIKTLVPTATLGIQGTWTTKVNGEFQGGGAFGPMTVVITPEPASMLLLAAGAAFFARRRKA